MVADGVPGVKAETPNWAGFHGLTAKDAKAAKAILANPAATASGKNRHLLDDPLRNL
jgi:hypothetical protein